MSASHRDSETPVTGLGSQAEPAARSVSAGPRASRSSLGRPASALQRLLRAAHARSLRHTRGQTGLWCWERAAPQEARSTPRPPRLPHPWASRAEAVRPGDRQLSWTSSPLLCRWSWCRVHDGAGARGLVTRGCGLGRAPTQAWTARPPSGQIRGHSDYVRAPP